MKSKVSILLLSYNQKEFIKDSIESSLNQSYKNLEIVISDNGSTDGTDEIIKSYQDHPQVKLLLNNSNEPTTKRYNQALRYCEGEYISILYGDDYYLPEKIEKQLDCFKNLSSDWGVVHGPGYNLEVSNNKQTLAGCTKVHGEALEYILKNYYDGFINPISPLVRRNCFLEYPSYEDLFTEGECLYLKFALKYKFFFLDDPLVVMREHETNARWFSKRNSEILDTCLERLEGFEEFPQSCTTPLQRIKVKALSNSAWQNIRLGVDVEWARKKLINAYRLSFISFFFPRNMVALLLTLSPNFLIKFFNNTLDLLLVRKKQIYK